jgi:hypothetical protein
LADGDQTVKHLLLVTTLLLFLNPIHLAASDHYRHGRVQVGPAALRPARPTQPVKDAAQPAFTRQPGYRAHRGHRPGKPCRGRPVTWWPIATAVAPQPAPVVIVFRPPPEPAPLPEPEPKKEWVPPVMATRTEPGYWDHPIKKVWMGDHWRFVQHLEKRRWVPEAVVAYVKQAGYWKTID